MKNHSDHSLQGISKHVFYPPMNTEAQQQAFRILHQVQKLKTGRIPNSGVEVYRKWVASHYYIETPGF